MLNNKKDDIKKILEKIGNRTKDEFEILIKYAIDNKSNNNIFNKGIIYHDYKQYNNEYNKCKEFIKYNITLHKSKRVVRDTSTFRIPDEHIGKELMGEEAYEEYKKKMELLKVNSKTISVKMDTVEYECPITIYMNYDTGLYSATFEIYKNFLFNNDKLYSFNKIATFLGYELNIIDRGSKMHKDIYLVFIKNYNEMDYVNINDMLNKPNTEIEKKIYDNKKLLKIDDIKKDIENGARKIVEFSNIIEDSVNQIIPKGSDGKGYLDK
jgi:hypothetical protein